MSKIVYLYVLDTMADWEPGLAIAELNSGRFFAKDETYRVEIVGHSKKPIKTIGGMTIVPDKVVDEVEMDKTALLILPGSDAWDKPEHRAVIEKTQALLDADKQVAAICGATVALAMAGMLDNRPHTSNDLGILKKICPDYKGEKYYRNEPAVTDGNLITATGVAPIEFTYHILKKLDVLSPETLKYWHKLFTQYRAEDFYALMKSLPQKS